MPNGNDAVQVQAAPQPKTIRVLNLQVELDGDANAAEIIASVSELGTNLRSVSINNQVDYGYAPDFY